MAVVSDGDWDDDILLETTKSSARQLRYTWEVKNENVGGVNLKEYLSSKFPRFYFSIQKRFIHKQVALKHQPGLYIASADKHRPDDIFELLPGVERMSDGGRHAVTTFFSCCGVIDACRASCGAAVSEVFGKALCACGVKITCDCKNLEKKKKCTCSVDKKHFNCGFQLKVGQRDS